MAEERTKVVDPLKAFLESQLRMWEGKDPVSTASPDATVLEESKTVGVSICRSEDFSESRLSLREYPKTFTR